MFEFINAREPINTLFYFGRPLWTSFEKQLKGKENESKCQEIIRLARIKIMTKENFRKAYSSLAILGLTTCLLSSISILKQYICSSLVADYMATLAYFDNECDVLYIRFVSEPILSEAAAYSMSDKENLRDTLLNLNELISTTDVASTGFAGELAAEIILLTAKNKKCNRDRMNASFSRPVQVGVFLESLLGANFSKSKYTDYYDQLTSKFFTLFLLISFLIFFFIHPFINFKMRKSAQTMLLNQMRQFRILHFWMALFASIIFCISKTHCKRTTFSTI